MTTTAGGGEVTHLLGVLLLHIRLAIAVNWLVTPATHILNL